TAAVPTWIPVSNSPAAPRRDPRSRQTNRPRTTIIVIVILTAAVELRLRPLLSLVNRPHRHGAVLRTPGASTPSPQPSARGQKSIQRQEYQEMDRRSQGHDRDDQGRRPRLFMVLPRPVVPALSPPEFPRVENTEE